MNERYFDRMRLIKLGMLPKEAVAKKKVPLKKISDKKAAELKVNKGSDSELDLWFETKRKQMKGRCELCGGKTEKANDETYRRSIHHLLDKRKTMFPSVATHPDNFLEVCFFGNSCHTQIHNGKITYQLIKDSKEWDLVKERLLCILPMVADAEKKNKMYNELISLVYGKLDANKR